MNLPALVVIIILWFFGLEQSFFYVFSFHFAFPINSDIFDRLLDFSSTVVLVHKPSSFAVRFSAKGLIYHLFDDRAAQALFMHFNVID